MLDHYKIITVTHRQTRLKEISNFVVSDQSDVTIPEQLRAIKARFGIDEIMYLATCNRVMYFFYHKEDYTQDEVVTFLQAVNPALTEVQILEEAILYTGADAMNHLLEVSASVDSMVVGEREILRQLRQAYAAYHEAGMTDDNLRLAMNAAVQAAKQVYATTRIGEKPVSIVSLAVQKLLQFELRKDARLLLIGAGQTNTLVTKFLVKHQFTNVTVFNRSLEKAQRLADSLGGNALLLNELPMYSEGFDCIIVCTGSTKPIITVERFDQLRSGEMSPKYLIDLSIPHNAERGIANLPGVTYVEIEDLRALAQQNLAFREKEVAKAKMVLGDHLTLFEQTYQQRQLERALRNLPSEIKAVKAKAVNEVFRKDLAGLDDDTLALVERMLTYMEKKCVGIPMKAAREALMKPVSVQRKVRVKVKS